MSLRRVVATVFCSVAFAAPLGLALLQAKVARASPGVEPAPAVTAAASSTVSSHWDFVDGDEFPIVVHHLAAVIEVADSFVSVEASVEGKPGAFLVDTGSAGIILSQHFAKSLALERVGSSSISGIASKSIAVDVAVVKNLTFGRSVLHDVLVDIAPDESVDTSRHLDGIVGYPVFAKAIVDVDLSAQKMRLYDPTRFEPSVTKQSYVFNIELTHRQPVIAGTIGNGVPIHPIFDSGNSLLVVLSHQLRDDGKVVTLPGTVLRFSGIDGVTDNVGCSHVNRLSFGAINYDGPIVCFEKASLFGKDGGIIGFDFLRHFNWTLDYPDKKFVLTPNGS